MLSHEDKMRGYLLRSNQLQRLPSLIANSNAIDSPCLQQDLFLLEGVRTNSLIYERLYRAISHTFFYDEFNKSTISYGLFTISDHASLIFFSTERTNSRPPPFRFQNFWTLDQHSHSIIKKKLELTNNMIPILSYSTKTRPYKN